MSAFASRSVPRHLARGLGAVLLTWLAARLALEPSLMRGLGAAFALAGAVVLLRGCPMCWLTGLFETISRPARRDADHD